MDEPVNYDFSKMPKEEVFTRFFYEIRGSVSSVIGYLTILNKMELSDEKKEHYIEPALKRALFIQDRMREVFQYLDEQNKDNE